MFIRQNEKSGIDNRIKKMLFYFLAGLLGGCVSSLHPLYTDKDIVFEEKLLGDWKVDDQKWEFEKGADPNSYKLIVTDNHGKGSFHTHLVKIDDMLFLDMYASNPEELKSCELWEFHILPVHTFWKVEQLEPAPKIRAMNADRMGKMLKTDPNLIEHEVLEDDRIVLTASTEELQKFMVKHADDEELFGDVMEFERLKIKDANEPNEPKTKDPNES